MGNSIPDTSPEKDKFFSTFANTVEATCYLLKSYHYCDGCPNRKPCLRKWSGVSELSSNGKFGARELRKSLVKRANLLL